MKGGGGGGLAWRGGARGLPPRKLRGGFSLGIERKNCCAFAIASVDHVFTMIRGLESSDRNATWRYISCEYIGSR